MLLAVAAVPGTVWPQRAQHPETRRHLPRPTTRRSARSSTGSAPSTSTRRSGSRRSTCCCSSRWSAASCRAPRCTSRACAAVRRARPRRFGRFPAQGDGLSDETPERLAQTATDRAAARLAAAAVRAHLPGRGARRGRRHVVGRRRARLPARDRQPGVPPGPRRPADLGGHRPGAALPRPDDRGAGHRASPTRRAPTTRSSAAPPTRRRASSRSRSRSTTSSPGSTRRRSRHATSPRT